MLHYLKAAFWARPHLPLVGPLPINAMAVAAVGLLGVVHPAFWLLGLGLETLYLFVLGSHSRFQTWVDAIELSSAQNERAGAKSREAQQVQRLVDDLGNPERQRLFHLKEQLNRIVGLYDKFGVDAFTLNHNRESLAALLGHTARLLAARQNILTHWSAEPAALQQELEQIERELRQSQLSAELRSSKTRTLEILQVRLLNQQKKETVLAEIDSELERIEQQFDLALENAAIGSRPQTVSAEVVFDPTQLVGEPPPLPDFGLVEPAPVKTRRRRQALRD